MRTLVTGAAGFIGSHLCEQLLARGDTVVGIDCFLDNYARERKEQQIATARESPRFQLVDAAILDLDLVELLGNIDRVFHLAALPGVRPSWGEAFESYLTNNVLSTQALLEACRRAPVERLVYASSSSVYGDTDVLPMREDAATWPYSPYGVTKLAAEHMVRLYNRNLGVPTVSVRYFTVYGPRQRPDMAIQRFLTAARDGKAIRVFGDGEQSRDFTYVADIVEGTRRAAETGTPGAVYNIGGGSRVTLNELIAMIEAVTGATLQIEREAGKPGDVRFTEADCHRAQEDLDFIPATSLQDGLAKHWGWLTSPAVDS
ncbi:MAG: GDP-mannose 4,6-dehydratase [Acidobacteriota bacterium]|jgi:UDP-glucose 4-epimerase